MAGASYIAIDEPSVVDKKLDTYQLTVGADTVERERVIQAGQGATDVSLPVAHDAADAGNPIKIGGRGQSSAPSDVSATNDRVDAYFDMKGRLKVDASDVAVPITDNSGSLTVDGSVTAVSGTATNLKVEAVGTGTFAVQATVAAAATNIAKAEDAASASADVGVPAMAVQLATPADLAGTDADYAMLQMSAGRLWASVKVDTALPAGTNAIGKLSANSGVDIGDVDVTTVGTITPGTAATALGKAEDGAHADGDVGVMALTVRKNTAASTSGTDGDYQPLITNTTGHLWVDASGQTLTVGSHAVTNAGTFAVQAVDAGDVAHDGADSGNPVKVGAKAVTSLATTTLVAGGDRTNNQSDLDGALLVRDQTPLGDTKSDAISNTDGASTASAVFTAVASTKNYITGGSVFRTDTGTTMAYVDFRDGSGGAVLWRMPLPPTGGSILPASPIPYFKTSANTALAYDVSAALSTIYISMSGFQSKL